MLSRGSSRPGCRSGPVSRPPGSCSTGTGGATLRASGSAAAALGLPGRRTGYAAVAELPAHVTPFALAGATALTITVVLAGGNVVVPVDLSPSRFAGAVFVRRNYVARAIIDDLRARRASTDW